MPKLSTETELRDVVNRTIMALRAAHDAYIAMAFDAAAREDAFTMCRCARRAQALVAEANQLERITYR